MDYALLVQMRQCAGNLQQPESEEGEVVLDVDAQEGAAAQVLQLEAVDLLLLVGVAAEETHDVRVVADSEDGGLIDGESCRVGVVHRHLSVEGVPF